NGPLKGHQPLNNPPWLSRHQELKFADSVANSSGSKSCTMQMIENTNRNTGEREAPVARKCSYKEFMSCHLQYHKGL
ncbi:hypothetical protein Tco_0700464, partial [Tanacetum coccineum]